MLGLALVAILAIVLGIFVHFGLSIALIVIYIITIIILVRKLVKENERLSKQIHFNVCLMIRNENERLYSKHSLRAKVGFMSQWIEFHAVNHNNSVLFGLSHALEPVDMLQEESPP